MGNGFNDLSGSDDNGFGGLSGDVSMRERDLANIPGGADEMSMSFGAQPQSLSDYDTMGMGEGLSAVKEQLGSEEDGIQLNAALEDEEEETAIHAGLEDEEQEAPIKAGRADPAPINAGFGKPQQAVGEDVQKAEEQTAESFDAYEIGGSNLSMNSNQNIDDIFIAGSYNRATTPSGGKSAAGGTMYDPNKDKKEVNISFGMPPLLKKLLILAVVVIAILGGLKYGLHINVQRYVHPVDVQQYVNDSSDALGKELGYTFKSDKLNFNSSSYEYTYDIKKAGGLQLVDVNGKRWFIEVTGLRVDCSIYGIRPQLMKYSEATVTLASHGFKEIDMYEETEELGAEGQEHCFYNEKTGEGVIVGKKSQYNTVKAVKYVPNYKNFIKERTALRG